MKRLEVALKLYLLCTSCIVLFAEQMFSESTGHGKEIAELRIAKSSCLL
jgi:hypothetical protein